MDDIEHAIDYVAICEPRYSNILLEKIKFILNTVPPRGHKLLLIATTCKKELLKELGLIQLFDKVINVPVISCGTEVFTVLEQLNCFPRNDMEYLGRQLKDLTISISIKKLLHAIQISKFATDMRSMLMRQLKSIFVHYD